MFEPPVHSFNQVQLQQVIDLAMSKNALDLTVLTPFVQKFQATLPNSLATLTQNNQASIYPQNVTTSANKFSDLIFASIQAYFEKIPGDTVNSFIFGYLNSFDRDKEPTKYLVLLTLYLIAQKRYPEMMAFSKLISEAEAAKWLSGYELRLLHSPS